MLNTSEHSCELNTELLVWGRFCFVNRSWRDYTFVVDRCFVLGSEGDISLPLVAKDATVSHAMSSKL